MQGLALHQHFLAPIICTLRAYAASCIALLPGAVLRPRVWTRRRRLGTFYPPNLRRQETREQGMRQFSKEQRHTAALARFGKHKTVRMVAQTQTHCSRALAPPFPWPGAVAAWAGARRAHPVAAWLMLLRQ